MTPLIVSPSPMLRLTAYASDHTWKQLMSFLLTFGSVNESVAMSRSLSSSW